MDADPDLDPTFHFDADPDQYSQPTLSFTKVAKSDYFYFY